MPVSLNRATQNYIDHYIIEDRPIEESPKHFLARISLTAFGALACYLPTVSDFTSAVKWADSNPYYATILIIGHTTTMTSIYLWALSEIIQDRLEPQSEEEKQLIQGSTRRWLETAIKVTAIILGLIIRIPAAYNAYVTNNDSWAMAFLASLAFELPAFSLLLVIHRFILNRTLSGPYLALHNAKQILHQKIADKREELLHSQDLENDIARLFQDREQFLKGIINARKSLSLPPGLQVVSYIIGTGLAVSLLTLTALLSYHFGFVLYPNSFFAGFTACGITAAFSYLMIAKSNQATEERIKDLHHIVTKRSLPPTPSILCYKTVLIGKWFFYIFLPIAYGPLFQACKSQAPFWLTPWLQAATYTAIVIIALDVLGSFGEKKIAAGAIRLFGPESKQKIIRAFEKLDALDDTSYKASYRNFARFLKRLQEENEDLFHQLLSQIPITEAQLNEFLGISRTQPHLEAII